MSNRYETRRWNESKTKWTIMKTYEHLSEAIYACQNRGGDWLVYDTQTGSIPYNNGFVDRRTG